MCGLWFIWICCHIVLKNKEIQKKKIKKNRWLLFFFNNLSLITCQVKLLSLLYFEYEQQTEVRLEFYSERFVYNGLLGNWNSPWNVQMINTRRAKIWRVEGKRSRVVVNPRKIDPQKMLNKGFFQKLELGSALA